VQGRNKPPNSNAVRVRPQWVRTVLTHSGKREMTSRELAALSGGVLSVGAWLAARMRPVATSDCALALGKLVAVSGPRDIWVTSMAVGCGNKWMVWGWWLTARLRKVLPNGSARRCCERQARSWLEVAAEGNGMPLQSSGAMARSHTSLGEQLS